MAIKDAMPSLNAQLSKAVNVQAEAMRSEIYGVLEEYRNGRGIKWPGLPHRSSSVLDPPARQSGRLMESVKVLTRATPRKPIATVGPDPAAFEKYYYPAVMEYGTREMEFGGRRVKPRPFMRTAVARYRQKMR